MNITERGWPRFTVTKGEDKGKPMLMDASEWVDEIWRRFSEDHYAVDCLQKWYDSERRKQAERIRQAIVRGYRHVGITVTP